MILEVPPSALLLLHWRQTSSEDLREGRTVRASDEFCDLSDRGRWQGRRTWEVEDEMPTVNFVTADIWDCFGLIFLHVSL